MAHQRLATDDRCVRRPCDRCIEVHRGRVVWFVSRGIPVEFVLPAFPAKSPNTAKVLGATPDMAERLSLQFLCAICDRVRQIYRAGAKSSCAPTVECSATWRLIHKSPENSALRFGSSSAGDRLTISAQSVTGACHV